MFQKDFDVDLCLKYLKQIVRTVQCSCSSLYSKAYTCECGHSLCGLCWKPNKSCPTCGKTKSQNRHQNEELEKRSYHIKNLIDAFKTIAPTADNIIADVHSEYDNKNETIFEPIPKINHIYINKRKNKQKINSSDLPSVSQNESNFVFPGEAIDISKDNQNRSNKPGSLENVKSWLESTQNQFSERTDSQLENMKIVSNLPTANINSESRGGCNVNINQSDWDKIEVMESETTVDYEKQNTETSYDVILADVSTNEPRRSSRNKVKSTNKVTTRRKSIKSDHKIVTDQITIEHYLDPTTTKAEISSNSNANSSSEKKLTNKKEMWSSVKKMEHDFNKTNKRKVKKLNVSIVSCKKSETVISKASLPVVEDANKKQSPNIIEDSTPATPIIISSNERVIDKDRDACLQVLKKSYPNHTDMKHLGLSLKSIDATDETVKEDKLQPILNKREMESEVVQELTCRSLQRRVISPVEVLQCKTDLIGINANTKSVISSSVTDLDLPPVFLLEKNSEQEVKSKEKQSSQTKRWFPFIKKGKILGKCFYPNRRVPFYYKNQCRAPQTTMDESNFVIIVEKKNVRTYINISNTDKTQRDRSKISIRRSNEIGHEISEELQSKVYNYVKDKLGAMPLKSNINLTQESDIAKSDIIIDGLKANRPVHSLKKGTESADTVTVIPTANADKVGNEIQKDVNVIMDCDIFNSGSFVDKASGVIHQHTEMLQSADESIKTQTQETDEEKFTVRKKRSLKKSNSRSPLSKKFKGSVKEDEESDDLSIVFHSEHALENKKEKSVHEDSELMNYDEIIGKVFADIDAEIEENTSDNKTEHLSKPLDVEKQVTEISVDANTNLSPHNDNDINKIFSENMFSTVNEKIPGFKTLCKEEEENAKQNTEMLSRNSKIELDVTHVSEHDLDEDQIVATPRNTKIASDRDDDESDKSVVEDTPQKPKKSKRSISYAKSLSRDSQLNQDTSVEIKSVQSSLRLKQSIDKVKIAAVKKSASISREIRSLLNESVEVSNTQKESVTELVDKISKENLEITTPLNITKFTTDIKHNSTPMHPNARKLLDFNKQRKGTEGIAQIGKENVDTTSLSNVNVSMLTRKTSLEKDMMQKAFITPSETSVSTQRLVRAKFTLACSCLQPVQITNVKILALRKGWNYIDQYSPNLTHLIVAVDEGNKSQRSVKYMRALAAGKWIVSYDWILESLKQDKVVNEAPFEVLDSTGAMGPSWSRTATKKLFTGIKFFCMPPFTILDEKTLSQILEDAGGTVVKTIEEISLKTSKNVSLLIAEPESTQDDRFIYTAACHSVVPVNFEWALNSLGCYELTSIRNLLLCPESLVCFDKLNWPKPLVDASSEETDYNTCE